MHGLSVYEVMVYKQTSLLLASRSSKLMPYIAFVSNALGSRPSHDGCSRLITSHVV